MKSIERKVKNQIRSKESDAGGKVMRVHAVSDPRFSRIVSSDMFAKKPKPHDEISKAKANPKETYNPSKNVKPLKRMKNGGKGK
jgi:hypothetical protein